jgi:hypothetical protein
MGDLHLDILKSRLKREYGLDVVLGAASASYPLTRRPDGGGVSRATGNGQQDGGVPVDQPAWHPGKIIFSYCCFAAHTHPVFLLIFHSRFIILA